MTMHTPTRVTVIGAGFTGLSAAYELATRGFDVTVLETEDSVGGLAAAFDVGGEKLDRFYHHWFTSDQDVMQLVAELGLDDRLELNPTNTGVYYANNFFKLSTPWDLLNFTPLSLTDRVRLGLLALRARGVKDWKALESKTAADWLRELGGENVYRVVWEPLLKGKFGPFADDISAVWFWNKLKLRGGSRGKGGQERLAYLRGGFVAIAEELARRIVSAGGRIELRSRAEQIDPVGRQWHTRLDSGATVDSDIVIATTPLPVTADLVRTWAEPAYLDQLERVRYIGNVCLVLELTQALSKTYWLNVNDPKFPFVGVIEHTNFERPETYAGRHIVYLSKYLPVTDTLYSLDADAFLEYSLPYLRQMFPQFNRSWILKHHLWKARWSQPVVEKHYSRLIPDERGPRSGFYVCSMAQIYPEDRGTNYAIQRGRRLARAIASERAEPRQA